MIRRLQTLGAMAFLMTTAMSLPIQAQEGHPLAGSWHGAWGVPGAAESMDLTLIINWDGTAITGLVNPLTDRAALENASLNSGNWTVRFEVDVEDAGGTVRRCIADGTLEKLGSDRRELAGTWSCEGLRAEFRIIRDRDY